ncbi:ATP-binding protein [Gilvimarinus xylanilyticus]|uniref:ATP-binding protein n=1 Tax=Gilvimarinus xylanilyticus TaxID=2944139 RepID=A0A9X2KUZ2_9GAMM|nr:ATP-binding protein [Gilvimarinus xylanilyticus]MCP8900373.1 ATP-binding protein [Gilvimarinus xylanilyticus]
MIDQKEIEELVRLKGTTLFHREGQELEFKEQFSLAGLADYFRDFAAFSNNRGGYLIHGIKDTPRTRTGLSEKSIEQFEKIDPEKITGYLLEIFSADIRWEQSLFEIGGVSIGVFKIYEASVKPVIAKKDEGKDQIIKNGEIYYRYGGRTQKIQAAELENIINKRVEQNNQQWLDLMSKIGRAGPQNAAILDTERALIEKDDSRVLVLDDDLASKLKFVKEGQFVEKNGAATLKLVGDVVPVDRVEVVKRVKENLTKAYPLSALELVAEVQKAYPLAKQGQVWDAIADNDMKNNPDYSVYNFRNKRQEDTYNESGVLPKAIPSIYNEDAVAFIVKVLKEAQ